MAKFLVLTFTNDLHTTAYLRKIFFLNFEISQK